MKYEDIQNEVNEAIGTSQMEADPGPLLGEEPSGSGAETSEDLNEVSLS